MFRGSVKGTGYPLHSPVSPSLPLPFLTVYHYISTVLCLDTTLETKCHSTKWNYVSLFSNLQFKKPKLRVRCEYLILLECSSVHGTQQRPCGRRMLGLIVRITLNNLDSRGSSVERFGCVFFQTTWLSVRSPPHFTRPLPALEPIRLYYSTILYKRARQMREKFSQKHGKFFQNIF